MAVIGEEENAGPLSTDTPSVVANSRMTDIDASNIAMQGSQENVSKSADIKHASGRVNLEAISVDRRRASLSSIADENSFEK